MTQAALPVPAPPMVVCRCHRCSYFIGEAPGPLEFVGVFKQARDRALIPPPRIAMRCKCGWVNLYRPLTDGA